MGKDSQINAVDALVHLHSAIKNLRPSFPDQAKIIHLIEVLYLYLLHTLRQDVPSAFVEIEKKSQHPAKNLNQQEYESIRVSSLLDILLGFSIEDISCNKDLEKEGLDVFIKLLGRKPESAQNYEYLLDTIVEDEMEQIRSDNETMESVASEQGIVSDQDIAQDGITEIITEMEKVFTRLNVMHGAIESLPTQEKKEEIKKLSVQVAKWIEIETIFTPSYKEICGKLQTLLQNFINYRFFEEADIIVNAFGKINDGTLKKDDKIQEASLEVLRKVALEENINILFKENEINEKNKTPRFAFRILVGLGDIVINKLLIDLRNTTNSKQRISILHVITEMGSLAIPSIKAKIRVDSPWYYLRNMAYLLGRIGDEDSIYILKPLLLHEEKRVSIEAFKSINQIGGNKRGSLFLAVLPQVDKELRVSIIETLGKIKFSEAVIPLRNMLKNKSSMAKEDQISLQEKICTALGSIGTAEAIQTLSEVAESKSILGISSYPKEVKYAAERALKSVRKK